MGRAEQCDGFVSLTDSLFDNMRSRWMPASTAQSDIGGHMDLFLFQIIRLRREIVFSPVSPQGQITLVNLPLEPHLAGAKPKTISLLSIVSVDNFFYKRYALQYILFQ
jgi:hypothetical protein